MESKGFATCRILGPGPTNSGLGNQLFCISATLAYAQEHGKQASFPQIDKQNDYSKYNKIFYYNLLKEPITRFDSYYKEPAFCFNKIPHFNGNVCLEGYFQSEKYFKTYKKEILDFFSINKIQDIFQKKYNIKENTCSLHVRRGDYLNLSNYHVNLTIDYYKKAIEQVGKEEQFLVFSDDIEWCKKEFNFLKNVSFSENCQDWQDIILMSLCKNNIIANSSFSWWGAWLNQHHDSLKIAPKKWFANNVNNDTNDLIPNDWKII